MRYKRQLCPADGWFKREVGSSRPFTPLLRDPAIRYIAREPFVAAVEIGPKYACILRHHLPSGFGDEEHNRGDSEQGVGKVKV